MRTCNERPITGTIGYGPGEIFVPSKRSGDLYGNLAITTLPHRDPGCGSNGIWSQNRNGLTFELVSGRFADGRMVGVPFGPTARLILIHHLSHALKTGSAEVPLGPSAYGWIKAMKGRAIGGQTYRQFSRQALRLSTCQVTVRADTGTPFPLSGQPWLMPTDAALHQAILDDSDLLQPDRWYAGARRMRSAAGTINAELLRSYGQITVPLDAGVIRAISNSASLIDIYIWLATLGPERREPLLVNWDALTQLFGSGYSEQRHFRQALRGSLHRLLPLIPAIRVEVREAGWEISGTG